MKPEDVPDEVLDLALQASDPHITSAFDGAEMLILRNWMRRSLALVWNKIYYPGFEEGLSTKISTSLKGNRENAATAMREHRAQIWSSGKVECHCGVQFPHEDLMELRVAERADKMLTLHEAHLFEEIMRMGPVRG